MNPFPIEQHTILSPVGSLPNTGMQADFRRVYQGSGRREAQLRQAEKLRSLGQLTSGIAHDINNLLAVITANLEIALDQLSLDSPATDLLANALRATHSGGRLNSQLLSFGREKPIAICSLEISAFLQGFVSLVRRTIGPQYSIALNNNVGGMNVQVDVEQLQMALINLCFNARDAMQDGGTINIIQDEIYVSKDMKKYWRGQSENQFDSKFVSRGLNAMEAGQYYCVSVSDTGIGMSEDVCAKIFDPFFTTKSEGGGVGLGLSMVLAFVEQSGGGLIVESKPGQGTCFRLILPAANMTVEVVPSQSPRYEQMKGRVLLVDDEQAVLQSAALVLRSLGLSVETVQNTEEALSCLDSDLHYDFLLSDVALGSQPDGIALADRARTLKPHLAIVLTSGLGEESLGSGTLDRLRAKFLAKPYRRRALREALEAAL